MIVTVVTPTWNGVEFLKECIESARRNETKGVEVEHVIVDAGSTDGTVELAESYGLRVMKGKDKGIFDAINKGSFNSSGELLGFLGSDDVLLDGALPAVVEAYKKSGRRWVVGGIRWINDKGEHLGDLAAPPSWMTPRIHVCLNWNPIMHMATYFNRELYTELGGFNIDFKHAGDFDMFARALAKEPYARVPRMISCFRRTGNNHSVVNYHGNQAEDAKVRARYAPSSQLEVLFWRYAMKVWFNFGNPSWMAHKVRDKVRYHLQLQEKTYF